MYSTLDVYVLFYFFQLNIISLYSLCENSRSLLPGSHQDYEAPPTGRVPVKALFHLKCRIISVKQVCPQEVDMNVDVSGIRFSLQYFRIRC